MQPRLWTCACSRLAVHCCMTSTSSRILLSDLRNPPSLSYVSYCSQSKTCTPYRIHSLHLVHIGNVHHYSHSPIQVQQAQMRVARTMYTRTMYTCLSVSHILYISISKSPSPVGDTSALIVYDSEPACATARIHSRKVNMEYLFLYDVLSSGLCTKFRYLPSTARGRSVKIPATGNKAREKHHNVNVPYQN